MDDTIRIVADNWYLLQQANKESIKYNIVRETHALVDMDSGDVLARGAKEVNLFLSSLEWKK